MIMSRVGSASKSPIDLSPSTSSDTDTMMYFCSTASSWIPALIDFIVKLEGRGMNTVIGNSVGSSYGEQSLKIALDLFCVSSSSI